MKIKSLFAMLLLSTLLLPNCNSEKKDITEIQRNLLIYLISPPHSNISQSSPNPNIYQTIFTNNCKTKSISIQGGNVDNFDYPPTVDDMIFSTEETTDELELRSASISGCSNLWNGAVIPFEIDPQFSNVNLLYSAFATWESQTVIRFIKRTNLHRDYIFIIPSNECSSFVGKRGGAQNVNLSSSCTYKNILHELGHVIGFYHEHQRIDRDNFITIHTENIQPNKLSSFKKLFPSYSFSISYDLYSIMHYTPYAFSYNSKPTITLKDQSANFGNLGTLSTIDVNIVNQLYQNSFTTINNIPAVYSR
ncbi:MAG TPA: M12 family metallopeptidase [Leptospiraceae bacterium]|nr:M12 family metallopeptidase [Leptospiraceae bacterium]HMX30906.1 M12 family metallopeptidase [Leptospiraceae bacterium]HMY30010.1 M12 family metallopeptidase [Leptospiraceae bacterium]HMZ65352.1 M12 family metallopeptidase [Leptospiraceae bacterium]HNA07318.1 M12 family metallopeptidase [Leptospiraceae bacterium]